MNYIIENVNLLKTNGIEKTSLLINENRIALMRKSMDSLCFLRMDMSSYLLTPSHVMLDFSLHSSLHFPEFKDLFIQNYLKKGCTTLLTVVDVQNEQGLVSEIKQRRHLMINSPIDYYLGVRLPFHRLSPSFLRKCRKQNISVVFVEVDVETKLATKSWGWIRDAMFSNPITLIPFVHERDLPVNKEKRLLQKWEQIMKEHKLSSVTTLLEEKAPLTKEVLMRIGIYPEKGEVRVGGQLNYNLYNLADLRYHTNNTPNISHNGDFPLITVHNGKLLNVNGDISFKPGIGEECFISISGRFMPQSASV
jgi:hypothetical protein